MICRRTTALTFATCHQPLNWRSSLTRSMTRRSFLLRAHRHADRACRRRRLARVSRVSRTASWEIGPSAAGDGLAGRRLARRRLDRHLGCSDAMAVTSHTARGAAVEPGVSPRRAARAPGATCVRRLAEPDGGCRVVEPAARAGRMREAGSTMRVRRAGSSCRCVGERRAPTEQPAPGEPPTVTISSGSEQPQLLLAPRAQSCCSRWRRRAVAASGRCLARVAPRDGSAVESS